MIEPNPMQIGPFLVPLVWLISFFLIWIGGKGADRFFPQAGKFRWSELLFEAMLLYLIVLKISPVLWDPRLIIDNPLSLLYGFGSTAGAVIAAAVSGLYIGWKARKAAVPWFRLLDAVALAALVAGLGYSLVFRHLGEITSLPWGIGVEGGKHQYHPIHFYRAAWLALVLAIWWRRRGQWQSGDTFSWIAIAGGLGMLLVSYLDYNPVPPVIGLHTSQWLFAVFAVLGWLQRVVTNRQEGKVDAH